MASIRKVTLADHTNIKQKDGGYVVEHEGLNDYPAYMTNYALYYGRQQGYFDTDILEKLYDIESVEDAYRMLYMGCVGADRDFPNKFTYEAFIEKLVYPEVNRVIYTAQTLLSDSLPDTFEEYTEQLKAMTKKEDGDKKK